jgi:hypothetical protein
VDKELKKFHLAKCIKRMSEIESRKFVSFEIRKSATERINNDIMLACKNGVISMKSVNDVTIFRGLNENEILAILG